MKKVSKIAVFTSLMTIGIFITMISALSEKRSYWPRFHRIIHWMSYENDEWTMEKLKNVTEYIDYGPKPIIIEDVKGMRDGIIFQFHSFDGPFAQQGILNDGELITNGELNLMEDLIK